MSTSLSEITKNCSVFGFQTPLSGRGLYVNSIHESLPEALRLVEVYRKKPIESLMMQFELSRKEAEGVWFEVWEIQDESLTIHGRERRPWEQEEQREEHETAPSIIMEQPDMLDQESEKPEGV